MTSEGRGKYLGADDALDHDGDGDDRLPCDGCTCCTYAGCHGGLDSECPYSEAILSFLCPCTGE